MQRRQRRRQRKHRLPVLGRPRHLAKGSGHRPRTSSSRRHCSKWLTAPAPLTPPVIAPPSPPPSSSRLIQRNRTTQVPSLDDSFCGDRALYSDFVRRTDGSAIDGPAGYPLQNSRCAAARPAEAIPASKACGSVWEVEWRPPAKPAAALVAAAVFTASHGSHTATAASEYPLQNSRLAAAPARCKAIPACEARRSAWEVEWRPPALSDRVQRPPGSKGPGRLRRLAFSLRRRRR